MEKFHYRRAAPPGGMRRHRRYGDMSGVCLLLFAEGDQFKSQDLGDAGGRARSCSSAADVVDCLRPASVSRAAGTQPTTTTTAKWEIFRETVLPAARALSCLVIKRPPSQSDRSGRARVSNRQCRRRPPQNGEQIAGNPTADGKEEKVADFVTVSSHKGDANNHL